jgi:hypothetical protein
MMSFQNVIPMSVASVFSFLTKVKILICFRNSLSFTHDTIPGTLWVFEEYIDCMNKSIKDMKYGI